MTQHRHVACSIRRVQCSMTHPINNFSQLKIARNYSQKAGNMAPPRSLHSGGQWPCLKNLHNAQMHDCWNGGGNTFKLPEKQKPSQFPHVMKLPFNTVWHEIFVGVYFCGCWSFRVLQEDIFKNLDLKLYSWE